MQYRFLFERMKIASFRIAGVAQKSLCVGWYWDKSEAQKLRCDTHHAGIQGKYLAAAVWFEFLTGLNPHAEGIKAAAISDEDAKFLSDIAHQVVTEGKRPALEKAIPAK